MKKIIFTLFLIMNVFMVNQIVEAAYIYIPNFRTLVSNSVTLHIEFLGREAKNYKGIKYNCWKYNVVDGKTSEYINRYVNKCTSRKFHFVLLDNNNSLWVLRYTGGQAKYVEAFEDSFHMFIERNGSRVNVNVVAEMYPE